MTMGTMPIHPWVAAGAHGVRFGVNMAALPDWSATRDRAQTVEGLGFDALLMPDHPMPISATTWTTLAALAGVTRTIRLGTLVSCVYYWNPVILAKCAADIDRISGGRMMLGVGSGDQPNEFRQLGLTYPPAPERQAMLEEALQVIVSLLRGQSVTFSGQHVQADGAVLVPPPVQQPYVPILVAGGGERTTLRFVAQYADACNLGAASWAGSVFNPDDARHKLDVLRQHCAAAGRPDESVLRTTLVGLLLADSPAALQAKRESIPPQRLAFFERVPIIGTPEEAATRVRALVEAGFQYVIFTCFDEESLHLAAQQVIPAVIGG